MGRECDTAKRSWIIYFLEFPYSPKGERCYALKSGKRKERVSWIAALKEGKVFAPLTFEGSCNRDLFETWLKESLIPQLQPGNIIIIDNATFRELRRASSATTLPLLSTVASASKPAWVLHHIPRFGYLRKDAL